MEVLCSRPERQRPSLLLESFVHLHLVPGSHDRGFESVEEVRAALEAVSAGDEVSNELKF